MIWLLIGYMFLFIHRPFEVWPVLAAYRVERVYMALTLFYWIFFHKKVLIQNRLNAAFLFLSLSVLFSWLVSAYPNEGSDLTVENHFKVTVLFVLIITSVQTERELRLLVNGFIAIMALYMTHSLREFFNGRHEYRMGIVRMVAVDQSYSNPNAFAASMLCAMPLTFPLWGDTKWRAKQLFLVYYTGLTIICVILTGSRTGFVMMTLLGFFGVLMTRRRGLLLAVLLVGIPLGWGALPEPLKNRFMTLIDPKYGPKNAQESAEGRKEGFRQGMEVWNKHPVSGVGPGAFGLAAGHGFQTHNLYAQCLSELGTPGGIALAFVVLGFIRNGIEVRRVVGTPITPQEGYLARVSDSIVVAIALMLIQGVGAHNLYRYNWLWFGAFQSITLHCARSSASQRSGESLGDC
jgi:O-antigen ligase